MKKILFGLIIGFVLSFGVNVSASEINAQFVKMFDSVTGGNIHTFNQDSILDSKLGSESGTGDNIGGTLVLYNGGEKNPRVTSGTNKIDDAGVVDVLDKNSKIRATMLADDNGIGPIVSLTNSNGIISTYLTTENGYINGQKIITEDNLEKNYINKSDVQKIVDDAVQKALAK